MHIQVASLEKGGEGNHTKRVNHEIQLMREINELRYINKVRRATVMVLESNGYGVTE
jgi:hypothetical protein